MVSEPGLLASQARQQQPTSSKSNTSRPANKDPTRQCTVCGRTGHEASGCFTVIGYPDWWEGSQKPRVPIRPKQTESVKSVTPKANTATVAKTNTAKVQVNVTITDADRQGLSGITDEQWSIVQKLINKGTTNEHLKEALAVKTGLLEAVNLGLRTLTIWSDSQSLSTTISSRSKSVEAQGVLFDIEHLCNIFSAVYFRHVPRLNNVEADALAKFALSNPQNIV
uniref:RNase H type-1 domain-containing protein n=1 Tax=Brassica campestris TaxID=3711 RepID=M4EYQ1_BRACM